MRVRNCPGVLRVMVRLKTSRTSLGATQIEILADHLGAPTPPRLR